MENVKVIVREFKTADIIEPEAQIQIGENIGETDTHALILEMKEAETRPIKADY